MTAHGSFGALCPGRGVPRDHTTRECHRRGPAELGEPLPVSISEDDVPDGAIRQRAVIQGFSWGHWLRATSWCPGCRRSCKVSPTRSSRSGVLLFCRDCTGCVVATVWRHRSHRPHGQGDAAADAFGHQSLPTMLLSRVQREAVIRGGNVGSWV